MENDKRIEELQNENARLRELLSEVLKAYDTVPTANTNFGFISIPRTKTFIISVVPITLRITEALVKQGITSGRMRLRRW